MSRELKFASTNAALQHLANVTGRRVIVATPEYLLNINDETQASCSYGNGRLKVHIKLPDDKLLWWQYKVGDENAKMGEGKPRPGTADDYVNDFMVAQIGNIPGCQTKDLEKLGLKYADVEAAVSDHDRDMSLIDVNKTAPYEYDIIVTMKK